MVAYSFKAQFRGPIMAGNKRQTIRANGKRRHARPGEELQLYTGMRTRQCQLLCRARCLEALPIQILFRKPYRTVDKIRLPGRAIYFPTDLDAFAVADGFADWHAFREFWAENHPGVVDFDGMMIRWEPLTTKQHGPQSR